MYGSWLHSCVLGMSSPGGTTASIIFFFAFELVILWWGIADEQCWDSCRCTLEDSAINICVSILPRSQPGLPCNMEQSPCAVQRGLVSYPFSAQLHLLLLWAGCEVRITFLPWTMFPSSPLLWIVLSSRILRQQKERAVGQRQDWVILGSPWGPSVSTEPHVNAFWGGYG